MPSDERAHDGEADARHDRGRPRASRSETGGFWTDQLKNTDQLAAYHTMAEEIWTQTGGRIDGFVQSVGTAASLRGIGGSACAAADPRLRVVAVEPAESPVLSGGRPGAHKIDGDRRRLRRPALAAGRRRPDRARLHRRTRWRWPSAWPGRRGSSPGRPPARTSSRRCALAEQLGPAATVVTVMCDTGMKYLKTYGAELGRAAATSPTAEGA